MSKGGRPRLIRTYILKGGSLLGVANTFWGEEFCEENEPQGRLAIRATPKKRGKK